MPRRRPDKGASSPNIRLKQPDRSSPAPNKETLLELAKNRGLFEETNNSSQTNNDATPHEEADPPIGRLGEAILWSISIAMLHLTFDVLVQHQYAKEISWWEIVTRSSQAFGGQFSASCHLNICDSAELILSHSSPLLYVASSP